MITFTDDKVHKSSRISLQGEINIYCSDEVKEAFLTKLNGFDSIYLDHGSVSEMDISYMQILFSAIQTSAKLNKKIIIENNSAAKLKALLASAGFDFNSKAGKLITTAINTEKEN